MKITILHEVWFRSPRPYMYVLTSHRPAKCSTALGDRTVFR